MKFSEEINMDQLKRGEREREERSERPNSEEMVMMVKRSSAVFAKKIKRY